MVTRGIDQPNGLTDRYYIAVIRADALTLTQRMAGVVCCEEADEHGRITESVGDIADRWHVSRRTFVEHIAALVKHGWLHRESIPGKASLYELRIPGSIPISLSDVSRETNANSNSNVIGIGRGILNSAEFLSGEHGFHLDTAIALAQHIKATVKPRTLAAYVRRIPYSDLRAMLDDLSSIPAPRTGDVGSNPKRDDRRCEIHPDHIGGITAQGVKRCPLCRMNPERTGQRS